MITLQNGAVAFLHNNGQYLLLKRAETRKIAPGLWSGVGGHMESNEINDPLTTCYREIEEETGITKAEITSLELLYIIIRKRGDVIRQNYIYFGNTTKTEVVQTEEGVLSWVPESKILDFEYTKTFCALMEHFTNRSPLDRSIYVGIADNNDKELQMNWSRCEDFES